MKKNDVDFSDNNWALQKLRKEVERVKRALSTPVKADKKVTAYLCQNISSVKENKKQRQVFYRITNQEKEIKKEEDDEYENKKIRLIKIHLLLLP